ncbi:MAG: enoyl-CoA hydratase-related protein [Desulfomonilaceae bacterium]
MEETESKKPALVVYTREGAIGIITLNRPDKRNALNLSVWLDLGTAVSAAEADDDARVVLVKGQGKAFCAGLDLSPNNDIISYISAAPSASQKMAFYNVLKKIQDIHTRLERLSKPTIAVIQGYCLGAGLELALCCDIRLCSADAVFALPEAKLAIITDVGGLQRLSKVVGCGHAREIAFRGHRFDAEHARAIQLVNRVYPDHDALFQEAAKMAEEIAANPPLAVQGAKDVLMFTDRLFVSQSLEYNAARSAMIMPSDDLYEAFAAFMQKREGQFKGS